MGVLLLDSVLKKNPKVKFSQVDRQIFNKTIKCWFYFAVQHGVCYISCK